MTVFTMVALIVAFGTTAGVLNTWIKSRDKNADRANSKEAQAMDARVKALEERIKVLERLATDKTHRLSEEIDAL